MLRLKLFEAGLVVVAVTLSASCGYADDFSARLSGFNEIGSIPTTTPAAGSPTGYTGANCPAARVRAVSKLIKTRSTTP